MFDGLVEVEEGTPEVQAPQVLDRELPPVRHRAPEQLLELGTVQLEDTQSAAGEHSSSNSATISVANGLLPLKD